jgi:two-component system response regulator
MFSKQAILLIEACSRTSSATCAAFKAADISNQVVPFAKCQDAMAYLEAGLAQPNRQPDDMPAFVLLSIKTSDLRGLDFLRWLRAHSQLRKMPVVVFSENEQPDLFNQAYDAGANSCLAAPLDQEQLMKIIKSINGYWVILVEKPLL